MVGHTRLLRFADLSFIDEKADKMFKSTAEKIDFFASVGALPAPDLVAIEILKHQDPAKNFDFIKAAAMHGSW